MTRTHATTLSLFVFSVCTSVATPLSVAPNDASIVDSYDLEKLADAQLATVIGGEPLLDSTCDALFRAADVGYALGRIFRFSGFTRAGAGLDLGARMGGCER